jgi:uncharacterized membrane protein
MHAKKVAQFWLPAFAVMISMVAYAHDGKDHKHQKKDTAVAEHHHTSPAQHHATGRSAGHEMSSDASAANTAGLQEFPTLHPLVVHFPIVLLIIGTLLQWTSVLLLKKELSWVAWALLLLGFVGAYAASTWFHAHTTALPPAAQHVLEEHEQYAGYTQWFSGTALVLQSVNLFLLKRKIWMNWIVAILITIAALFVVLAGHHGAELVHKHGIGAKGHLLEQH